MKPQDEYTLWPAAFRYYLGRAPTRLAASHAQIATQ